MYSIVYQQYDSDWDDTAEKIAAFIGCSNKNELTVSEYSEYWYSRIEPDSNIISDSINKSVVFSFAAIPKPSRIIMILCPKQAKQCF